MEWFLNGILMWLGLTFAPVIVGVAIVAILMVIFGFAAIASRVDDCLFSIKKWFKHGA